ncbi:MAG: NAD-dependent epimerase/dehydratase family protein [Actinomycetota bacterium]
MNYFITGATGFLGGYVTSELLEGGHAVTALVADRDEARDIAEYGVRPHIGTLTDKEALRRGVRNADGVFHVAGHRLEFGERKTAEAVNVVGTRNVLELVREHAIHRVVVTSTLGVYSDTHGAVVDESHHFTGKHITTYDRIKAKVHYEVALPMMEKGLPAVLLMPGAIYGPRDTSLMADVLTRYLVGRARFVSAGTAYCWAHVEDVARAHLQAMQFGRNGESYIVSGEPHTVREVLVRAGRLVGRRLPPVPLPSWAVWPAAAVTRAVSAIVPQLRPTADRLRVATGVTYLGSDVKARAELGFAPRTLGEGLPAAVEWLLRDRFESVD